MRTRFFSLLLFVGLSFKLVQAVPPPVMPTTDVLQISKTAALFAKEIQVTKSLLEKASITTDGLEKAAQAVGQVNGAISKASQVLDIVEMGKEMIGLSKNLITHIKTSNFSDGKKVYSLQEQYLITKKLNVFLLTSKNLTIDLNGIAKSSTFKMNDSNRIDLISDIYSEVSSCRNALLSFCWGIHQVTAMRKERMAFPSSVYYLGNPANKYKINN